MTKICVERSDGHIVSVVADGHTGYGVEGEDIVCASVSTLVQSAALGLMKVAGVNLEFDRKKQDGYFAFSLSPTGQQRRDCDMILETMLAGLADLYESFSDFIELEVK